MLVSRKSDWGRTASRVLAVALTLALAGCPDDDDDDDDDAAAADKNCVAGKAVTVSGKVTYDFVPAVYTASTRSGTLDFARAAPRPVRGAVVQVREGSSLLTTGTTDDQGSYQMTYTPTCSGALSLVAVAKTTNPDIQIEDNTDGNAVWALGESLASTATTKNLHAGHGWSGSSYTASRRSAAPFAILDSMYTASRAFMAVRPVTFPALKVNWSPDNAPRNGDKASGAIGTSHFSFTENEIYILGQAGADTDEFDSHVIVHEWGHYFESNLSRSDSPGGPHGAGDVLDPRLSFGEGYGNALAAMLLPESLYVDTLWAGSAGALTAFGFDAEVAPSPTDDPAPGVFSESTVMRLLYDLYDSGTNESGFDNVALGLGPIHDVLVGPQKSTEALTTLGSFITGLKAQSGVDATAVHTLLANYSVGPLTSAFGDGDTKLRAMYNVVPNTYPYNTSVTFTGGPSTYNKQQQNRYYVFTGTGRTMNISASHPSEDVGIEVYRRGAVVGASDKFLSGTESVSLPTQNDTKYVLVVMGFKENSGPPYPVSISITSP